MSERQNNNEWVYIVLGAAAVALAASHAAGRVVSGWRDPLLTAASRYSAEHVAGYAGGLLARLLAHLFDPFVVWAPPTVLLAGGIFFYPLLKRAYGEYSTWGAAARGAAFAWTSAIGALLFFSVPAAWPFSAAVAAFALAGVNIFIAVMLFYSFRAFLFRGTRKLEQGPTIIAPDAGQRNILIGHSEHGLLPDLVRWLAGGRQRVAIPYTRLSNGMTILGEKGSGKSRMLFLIHDALRRDYPDTPILIHDPKGEWFRTYYDKSKDMIFAPHFEGSVKWDILGDFQRIPELRYALLSSAITAHKTKGDNFWSDNATQLLMEIFDFPKGRPFSIYDAQKRFVTKIKRNADDKTFQSVAVSAKLAYLDIAKCASMGDPDVEGRSIDDFLKFPGRILLLNDPSCTAEQIGAFNLFLTAFLLRALSMPDIPAGQLRCIALIDEALTFQLPEDVDRSIYAMCRSKGICIIAGAQRLPDNRQHERGEWQTSDYIFAMKVINQDTQQRLSKRAGQIVFKEKSKSRSSRENSDDGGSISVSEQRNRQDVLPPEYFGRLSPREFVLFHDKGIIAGRTADALSPQTSQEFPTYTSLPSVTSLSSELTEAASKT